jgi:hypothetical protein
VELAAQEQTELMEQWPETMEETVAMEEMEAPEALED